MTWKTLERWPDYRVVKCSNPTDPEHDGCWAAMPTGAEDCAGAVHESTREAVHDYIADAALWDGQDAKETMRMVLNNLWSAAV